MTARQKVIEAELQTRAILAGHTSQFGCPFCGVVTILNQEMCCYEAAAIVEAVLDHIEFKSGIETVDRVMNHLASTQSSALVN